MRHAWARTLQPVGGFHFYVAHPGGVGSQVRQEGAQEDGKILVQKEPTSPERVSQAPWARSEHSITPSHGFPASHC
jgi:hypothetical protein